MTDKNVDRIRAVTYTRVSTSDQDAQMQVDELRQAAQSRGWEIVGDYTDTISGSKEGPQHRRMMKDAMLGKFDVVRQIHHHASPGVSLQAI